MFSFPWSLNLSFIPYSFIILIRNMNSVIRDILLPPLPLTLSTSCYCHTFTDHPSCHRPLDNVIYKCSLIKSRLHSVHLKQPFIWRCLRESCLSTNRENFNSQPCQCVRIPYLSSLSQKGSNIHGVGDYHQTPKENGLSLFQSLG